MVRPGPKDRLLVTIGLSAIVVLAIFIAVRSNQPIKTGPKLIEADGVKYFACGGALWLLNEGNPKDPGERSYYVAFKDANGVMHELKRVRMLKVTELTNDVSACIKPE